MSHTGYYDLTNHTLNFSCSHSECESCPFNADNNEYKTSCTDLTDKQRLQIFKQKYDERKLKVFFEETEYDNLKKYLSGDIKKEYYRMTIPDEICKMNGVSYTKDGDVE